MLKRLLILSAICLLPNMAFAKGYHYCTGKITNIVTRGTKEDTQVTIEGMKGWARIGFGGEKYRYLHERQFSTLLAAAMSEQKVTLEFVDKSRKCSDNHNGTLIRYVRVRF